MDGRKELLIELQFATKNVQKYKTVTLTYNKQHYKNVRHQARSGAQIWLNKLRHLDAIQVFFANESPVIVPLKI